MIKIAKRTAKEATCYLIIQNADPSKEIVTLGQTYFAMQIRKQEIQDKLFADKKRVQLREEMTVRNKELAEPAKKPFDLLFQMSENQKWLPGLDSN